MATVHAATDSFTPTAPVLPGPVTEVTQWRVELVRRGQEEHPARWARAATPEAAWDLQVAWEAVCADNEYIQVRPMRRVASPLAYERDEPEPGTPLPPGVDGYYLGRGLVSR